MDLESSNGILPLWAQLPASAVLLIILGLALRMVSGRNARFVIFACWFRFMLSAFHVYTFQKVAAGLSVNALGSAGLFVLGLLILPRTLLLSKSILSAYLVLLVIVVSALATGTVTQAFEPIMKFGLLIVVALNCFQGLRIENERRFGIATVLSFSPLLVFQAISLLLNISKTDSLSGTRNFIGGYDHEAAFSVALIGLFIVAGVSRAIPRALKVPIVPITVVSVLFANYRTAILAMVPLLIYYALYGISRFFGKSLRPLVVAVSGFAMVVVGATALFSLERFTDLRTVIEAKQPLIQRPDEFSIDDRALLNGRSLIWSSYYYKWKDDGGQTEHLVGFGPDSWKEFFNVYAHNSFVDFLFEYGLFGVLVLFIMVGNGLLMAWNTGVQRWKMVSAHLSFLALNLATMPMWLVEGLLLYGLLWGYTMFYRMERKLSYRLVEEPPFVPALVT
ncbi:MAG: hypothetical protein ABI626_00765 [Sphingomicrobium sp.]